MRPLILIAVIGCGHPAPASPPALENKKPAEVRPAVAKQCKLSGLVYDGVGGDPLAGATVVMSGYRVPEEVVITDEQGAFSVTMLVNHRELHVYYANRTAELPLSMAHCDHRIRVPFDPNGPKKQPLPIIYDSP